MAEDSRCGGNPPHPPTPSPSRGEGELSARAEAMRERADVVVVGGGPGGAAAALTLAARGASVVMVDRSMERPTIGEGLPPAAMPVLRELGLWDHFLADGHRGAYGNRSAWGGSTVDEYDFIRSPYGAGWHLDRPRFDAMLTTALDRAGVAIYGRTRLVECHRVRERGWTLVLASENVHREVQADVLIDASGRARRVARAQGVRRRSYDRLIGVVGVLVPAAIETDCDSFTLVEAACDGWWYATLLQDGRLAIGYMTDADCAAEARARSVAGWTALLAQTTHIRDRVTRHGYRLQGRLRLVCAESSCLERMTGDGWCAVGDAAAAYDPLSSQGITTALVSGLWAGQAVAAGRASALAAYEQQMRRVYARYLAEWMGYYALEQRWPTSVFWQRRHGLLWWLMAA